MERKEHFRENWLIFLWVWGEAELILGICRTRQNTIRELRIFFQGFRKINAREQGSTDPRERGSTIEATIMKKYQMKAN